MRIVHHVVLWLLAALVAGCGAQQTHTSSDHGAGTGHNNTQADAAPYDAQFIDDMTLHHQGAVTMAEEALTASQRPEIKQLAQTIIATQNVEIKQMATWRQQWYPELAATGGTGAHMGDMQLASDAAQPFDQRFITAMISHHQGAIEMAKTAQTKAEHAEIKQLAGAIIQAQQAEIQQMQTWQQLWFK